MRLFGGGGRGTGSGAGGGRGGGWAAGPGGECVCPSCGHRQPHVRTKPCLAIKCPKCGTRMVRAA